MKKLFLCLLSVALMSLTLVSCGGSELQREVSAAQKELPMDLGDGMVCTAIELVDNYVTYTCEVDEDFYGEELMDMLEANKEDLKSYMLEPDEDSEGLIELCKKYNKGLAYIFKGNKSDRSFTVNLECDEL